MKNKLKLDDEQSQEVKNFIAEQEKANATPGIDGLIAFDDYLKIFGIIVTL